MGSIAPVYLLSVLALGERPKRRKQLAVLIVLAGVSLVATSSHGNEAAGNGGDNNAASQQQPRGWLGARIGVFVALLSSCIAACFKVLFQRVVHHETQQRVQHRR